MGRQLSECQKSYTSLDANSDIPLVNHISLINQLEGDGREALRRLDELKTEIQQKFGNDSAMYLPPELLALEQQWQRLISKVISASYVYFLNYL